MEIVDALRGLVTGMASGEKLGVIFSERERERTHVHVRYMLSPIRLSSVGNTLAALVRWLKFSAIFLWHLVPWHIHGKFYGDCPSGTPPPGGVKHKTGD